MPINSRNKGARFERRIASYFSSVFKRNIRRVPASGGLDIKCDLYDPENDNFRYYIECKFRESYRFESLINGLSPLYGVLERTIELAEKSYLIKKYTEGPVPIVIFKGGEFRTEWVMVSNKHMYKTFNPKERPLSEITIIFVNSIIFMPFTVFLRECIKRDLKLKSKQKAIIHDEEDGTPD